MTLAVQLVGEASVWLTAVWTIIGVLTAIRVLAMIKRLIRRDWKVQP